MHQTPSVLENKLTDLIQQLSNLPHYYVGRSIECDIRLESKAISHRHALLIECSSDTFLLEDLTSKNGTFVNDLRISRKVIGTEDKIRFADQEFAVSHLIERYIRVKDIPPVVTKTNPLDFTAEFTALKQVYEQYPKLRKDCRNRDKMVRTGSVILSSVVGVGAALASGGTAAIMPVLSVLSGAGLSMLVPTLCSTLLSTEEKLEVLEKEYREHYRCPNPDCRDPFYNREWEQLAQQKTCRRCKAIWVC